MRFSSRGAALFFCVALIVCGSGGSALSQTATSIPGVAVDAPTARLKPKQHPVVRSAIYDGAQTATVGGVLAAPISDSAKIARLATLTGSCVGGCATSASTPSAANHGCSLSAGGMSAIPCRNIYGFKSYEECRATSMLIGWRPNDIPWYCSSLALK
ncbi:hypothetical protein [Bradyrhizobium sp. BR 10289]|uniref:hypothetical protein n=1 Tax=Bradyrhizobium sp. BR 10289 TaxID=2749993 RepID=UPI001C64B5F6|nr:hypothetical protein [Bradyrhizobium sp. BR 10289]MBW7968425.1 hypothetical protein [Bradyrhizobium sp. BR 10289]